MPAAELPDTIDSLKDKTLLYVGCRLFVTTDDEYNKSAWAKLKSMGLKSLCVVLQKSEINVRWCSKLKAMRIIDEYNVDGLIHEKREDRQVSEVGNSIIDWLKEKNIEVNACCFNGDYMGMVGGYVAENMGIPWNSFESMTAAFMKNVTQQYVLKDPKAEKYGVPSYAVKTKKELLHALDKISLPVVLKPVCGSASVGCKVVYDRNECLDYFSQVTHGLSNGTEVCEKITFSQSLVVMEFLRGQKYTVDVVISKGKLVGGTVVERGPATLPYFWATSVSLPGDASAAVQSQLVEAAYRCCMAVGLHNGVYDVDLIRDSVDSVTPKLIEINPRPGGNCLMELIKTVYGIDLFLVNLLLSCEVDVSEFGIMLKPSTNATAYLLYLHRDCESLKGSFGYMLSLAKTAKISMFNPGWQTTTEMIYKNSRSVRPTCVLMSKDVDSKHGAVVKMARYLVDCKYFKTMEEALSQI